MARTHRHFLVIVSCTMLAFAASCGEIGEPDYGLGEGPITTESGNNDPVLVEPEVSLLDDSAVVAAEVFTPPRPDDYVPALLASTATGVFVQAADDARVGAVNYVGPRRLSDPLGSLSTRRVVDDFFGGLVVQHAEGGIYWYSDAAEAPTLLSEAGTLLDVGFLDATSQVYVFVADGAGGIDRIRLADNERSAFAVLAEGESLIDLSAGDGVQAAVVSNAQCGALVFYDALGQRVDLGGPETPECPVERRPAFGSVALNSDATEVAYTEVTYRSDGIAASTDVVIGSLGSTQERFRFTAGAPGQSVTGLWFDGERLAYLLSDDSETIAVLLDSTVDSGADGVAVAVPFEVAPAEVSFSRQPLAADW